MAAITPLTPEKINSLINTSAALILDTRPATEFINGFIPGSVGIPLDKSFDEWTTQLLSNKENIILVTEPGKESEVATSMEKAGFTQVLGFLAGGIEEWRHAGFITDLIIAIEADELAMDLPHDPHLVVVDVRRPTEYAEGHVTGASNIPLGEFNDIVSIAGFEENQNIYLHCGGGKRSIIAASLLKKQGFHNLRVVNGGFSAIKSQPGIETENDSSSLN